MEVLQPIGCLEALDCAGYNHNWIKDEHLLQRRGRKSTGRQIACAEVPALQDGLYDRRWVQRQVRRALPERTGDRTEQELTFARGSLEVRR